MEIWKPIVGYEGYYEVSSIGRVRSVQRTIPHKRLGSQAVRARIRRTHVDADGYPKIRLHKEGARAAFKVHRLVAAAFCHRAEGCDSVNHKNGQRADNRAENLEWLTHRENIRHSLYSGRRSALTNPNARRKVSLPAVLDIRSRAKRGETAASLARAHGISSSSVRAIIKRRTWTLPPRPAKAEPAQ